MAKPPPVIKLSLTVMPRELFSESQIAMALSASVVIWYVLCSMTHRDAELTLGARLAGERDLAAEYRVALGTVRRAVEELRGRGLVVTLPAKGTFIIRR